MTFDVVPILDLMIDFYQKPRDFERFQSYLSLLQGDTKGDLARPIGGFNPMAKPHVLEKLMVLKKMDAETIMTNTLGEVSSKSKNAPIFKVSLTLADDWKGGWTNRYTADFDSKFKFNALAKRQFCTPIFWTSEDFSEELIRVRTLEYAYRTIFWNDKKTKPQTLKDHFEQEQFVAKHVQLKSPKLQDDTDFLQKFYQNHVNSEDYALIFNFFYGDAASESLGFKTFGVQDDAAGFKFARQQ